MIILSLRTDKPEAELGLFDNDNQLVYHTWAAHRELAETLHAKIDELLKSQDKTLKDVGGIVCFKGPGSFTGLRIGLSVANGLAYGLKVPIIGIKNEENWLQNGLAKLNSGKNDEAVMPAYGAEVHITPPKS